MKHKDKCTRKVVSLEWKFLYHKNITGHTDTTRQNYKNVDIYFTYSYTSICIFYQNCICTEYLVFPIIQSSWILHDFSYEQKNNATWCHNTI